MATTAAGITHRFEVQRRRRLKQEQGGLRLSRDAMADRRPRNVLAERATSQRLIALVLAGVLCLNYPLLSLFSEVRWLLGVPLLYLYLFLCWGILIALAATILERRPPQPPSQRPQRGADPS